MFHSFKKEHKYFAGGIFLAFMLIGILNFGSIWAAFVGPSQSPPNDAGAEFTVDAGRDVGLGRSPVSGTKLSVNGKVFSALGGFVFPDNTIQTTAASVASSSGWARDDAGIVRLATTTDLVGIGTASPLGLLHVFGNNSVIRRVVVSDSGSRVAVIGTNPNLNRIDIGSSSTQPVSIIVNGVEYVRVSSAGLGISTGTINLNPLYTLNVSGTINADRVLNAVYAP